MVTLGQLQTLTEGVEYFKDVNVLPKEVVAEVKKKLTGPDAELLSGSEAQEMAVSALYGKLSMTGRNLIDAEMKAWTEHYNKKLDLAVLASDNIVKAYNDLIEAQFNACMDIAREKMGKMEEQYNAEGSDYKIQFSFGTSIASWMGTVESTLQSLGMSENEIKKYIIGELFEPSDDPKKIREILKARLNYNKTVTALLQDMLKLNHAILGITEPVAEALIRNMDSDSNVERGNAIRITKKALADKMNDKEFKKNGYWDYRSLGAGVLCITEDNLGNLEGLRDNKAFFVQRLLTYDIIIFGHGSSTRKDSAEMKKMEDLKDKYEKLSKEMEKRAAEVRTEADKNSGKKMQRIVTVYQRCQKRLAAAWGKQVDAMEAFNNGKLSKEQFDKAIQSCNIAYEKYNKLSKDLNDAYDKIVQNSESDALDSDETLNKITAAADSALRDMVVFEARGTKDNTEWTIQPVKTPAGTFTKVVPMVEALIKAGFKKIYLLSCNPGSHKLPKSITDRKDVTVAMGNNSVLIETSDFVEQNDESHPMYETACDLLNTETDVMNFCESMGIDYSDDYDLYSAYKSVDRELNENTAPINEGAVSVWKNLWEIAKRVAKAVVWFFKKLIEMCAKLVKWIIGRIGKRTGKLVKKIAMKIPILENAKVTEVKVDSIEDLRKIATDNMNRITKALKESERKQTENLRKYEEFTRKQASSSTKNESITLEYLRSVLS